MIPTRSHIEDCHVGNHEQHGHDGQPLFRTVTIGFIPQCQYHEAGVAHGATD